MGRLVQQYFRTKEQMLLFTLDRSAWLSGTPAELVRLPDPPPRAAVRALLVPLLPLDADRRQEAPASAEAARAALAAHLDALFGR
jgi:hypothetical protein